MKTLQRLFGNANMSGAGQFGMIIALAAILIIFSALDGGTTVLPTNVINVFLQYSYILILAIGMVQVIVAGHIDLSVGSVAAFTGIVVAQSMAAWHFPTALAIVLGLVVGAAAGAWQGFWVAFVRVPAFIVTLAGQLIFRGLNQLIGNSDSVPVGESYQQIGAGFIPDFGPNTGFSNGTLLIGLLAIIAIIVTELRARRRRARMQADILPVWASVVRIVVFGAVAAVVTYEFAAGPVGTSVPIVALILGVLVLVYGFVTRNTILGRQIYAVGGNSAAAVLSGVSARRVNFFVMFNMSVLAAIAGMVFVAYSNASGPQDGTGWELDAIAAVFVGGAAVAGGIGTVNASIIGGLVMAFLQNGLLLIGAGSSQQQIIRGLVLLIAVGFDVYSKTQGRPSLTGRLLNGLRIPKEPSKTGAPAVQPESIQDQPKVTLP
ncbi:sugar ABC transporter permease [Amnibacterium soli]|uniref:Xylose transport system permease protein XylH n=1 Tax=Amnibacterium soli TaxID=1282736 RepID=A0ABP8YQZ9_9MICO